MAVRSPQARLEESRLGRALGTLVAGGVALGMLAASLPHHMPTRFNEQVTKISEHTGLRQGWGMFAWRPDPPPASRNVEAVITYDDGSSTVWRPSEGGLLWGAQTTVRWMKYVEYIRAGGVFDHDYPHLWRPTTDWLERTHRRPGRSVTRVELIAVEEPIAPFGDGAGTPPTTRRHVYFDAVYAPSS